MTLTTESKRGSDCSGTDGTTTRVLTLTNTLPTLTGGFSVYVGGNLLVPDTEYTHTSNTASSTITFINMVWDSDYIVVIYLQSGGGSLTNNYATYTDVFTRTGLSSSEVSNVIVDELISDSEAELESITGRKFTDANSVTEFLSIKDKDLIGNYQSAFQVSHWPVQSVTECGTLDSSGTSVSTWDTISSTEILAETYQSDDYWLEVANDTTTNDIKPTGRFVLKTQTLPEGTNNLKVEYTYGYADVPRMVTELAASMAGIKAWVMVLGGQYDSVNSYNLAEFSVNKGELHTKGKQNMEFLKMRIDSLLDRIGRKQRTMFFATGSDR